MVECSNFVFGYSNNATSRRKDRQGILFIIIFSEPVYSVLWWHGFIICCGYGFKLWPSLSPTVRTLENVFFCSFRCDLNHPLCGIYLLSGKFHMCHDECISRWTFPPCNMVLMAHQHQTLHPLLLPCA